MMDSHCMIFMPITVNIMKIMVGIILMEPMITGAGIVALKV